MGCGICLHPFKTLELIKRDNVQSGPSFQQQSSTFDDLQSKLMSLDSELESLNLKSNMTLKVVDVEGVPLFQTIAENWDSIQSFKARPDDLIICTYPKSGTTWMQEIVDMIQQGGDPQKCARAPIYTRIPLLEMCPPRPRSFGFELAEAMPSPRSIKTHLPVQLLPPSFWQHNCKIIYVARNIKDCAVSYFYFHRMHSYFPEPGNWNQFLEIFVAGKVIWGSWFDHVCGWWKAKDRHPILYLFYEDIKKNPVQEICKIAQFLGLELSELVVNQIVQHTVFENMKVNPFVNYTTLSPLIMDHSVSPFMRKGTVGDWEEHFTVAQSEWLDDICARELEGSGLTFRTHL